MAAPIKRVLAFAAGPMRAQFVRKGQRARARLALLSGTALVSAAASFLAGPASAAVFNVTNTLDSGAGSFRQAIIASNALGGTNTIAFAAGLGTITLQSDLPAVQNNVTISASNATLSGNNQFRGLFIGAFSGSTQVPVTVTVQDLTITNTKALGGSGANGGGGGAGLGGALFVA